MSISEIMTPLMDKFRKKTNLTDKLSIVRATSLMDHLDLHVNPNLLTGTKDFSGNWQTISGKAEDKWSPSTWNDELSNHAVANHTEAWKGYYQPIKLDEGIYTFSLNYVVADFPKSGKLYIYCLLNGGAKAEDVTTNHVTDTFYSWHRFSYTFKVTKAGLVGCRIESTVPALIRVASYKLEKGDLATPWCPNPADKVGG